ncbi:MAG: hypothetical protein IKA72_03600 [Clostridia bacterium]|nr:hypothetical protein [Clostridia bacterium]
MIEKLLGLLKEKYSLTAFDAGEFSILKANGMKFSVSAYQAEGLGRVSVMQAKGFFGLMKMDTLMITPTSVDLPLYSYDRIYAMGNDTLIVELYDTLINTLDVSSLDEVKAKFTHLNERDPGKHWYDSIKLKESISKKGKKAQQTEFDALALEHFKAYLNLPANEVADAAKKQELSAVYVNGLLEQGGPSTDVFKKQFGEEKTAKLFKQVLFGTDA